ncbi:hypothetical protein Psch_02600 [Pelotomaculum schinkii]|uniref:Uncharacterized protein n=1 Tax=Pelotomaculum schinkii TaxID=78350 RepID=A0A4Y7RA19_9FIRM|nr:DUF6323 family protein [Pelotomaculum schinkii]TEB05559.1 hypothetical protein Psch_02600 [Pelotomaculum schinkii]
MVLHSLLPFDILSTRTEIEQIIKCNEHSTQYGLVLTYNDAVQLVETRSEALRENGRIEIGSETIRKMITTFYHSSYINQQDYADTLNELLEIFYYMKNETLDLISDDELIELMRNYYENRCRGSLELLKHRELEKLARNLRFGVPDYANMDESDDEVLDEEEF